MELKNSTNQMVGLLKGDGQNMPVVPYDTGQAFNYDVTNHKGGFQQSLSCNYGMMEDTGLKQGIATSDSSNNFSCYQVNIIIESLIAFEQD